MLFFYCVFAYFSCTWNAVQCFNPHNITMGIYIVVYFFVIDGSRRGSILDGPQKHNTLIFQFTFFLCIFTAFKTLFSCSELSISLNLVLFVQFSIFKASIGIKVDFRMNLIGIILYLDVQLTINQPVQIYVICNSFILSLN